MARQQGPIRLEIQYHPGDIRRGVRTLFLTRRNLVLACVALGVWAGILLAALLASPITMGSWLRARDEGRLVQMRSMLVDRLEVGSRELADLQVEAVTLRRRVEQIYLAYGLSSDDEAAQGGYPAVSRESPPGIPPEGRRALESEVTARQQVRVLETFLQEILDLEAVNQEQARYTPSRSPLQRDDYVLTSPLGFRTSPFTKKQQFHAGLDMSAPIGTPIHAPASGLVVFAGRYPLRQNVAWWRFGNLVAIRHGERFITLFGHCDSIEVKRGDKVAQGDRIATVGNSGWSTNPHLHYSVWRDHEDGDSFRPVDPRIYMLDQQWNHAEEMLVLARQAPDVRDYSPLPRAIAR